MTDTKICSTCKRELPNTDEYYHRSKARRDGLKTQCKRCVKAKRDGGGPDPRRAGDPLVREAIREGFSVKINKLITEIKANRGFIDEYELVRIEELMERALCYQQIINLNQEEDSGTIPQEDTE